MLSILVLGGSTPVTVAVIELIKRSCNVPVAESIVQAPFVDSVAVIVPLPATGEPLKELKLGEVNVQSNVSIVAALAGSETANKEPERSADR